MNSIVKNELLKRLFEAEGEPVSGQEIADQFGLSRTAIWKYVKELEKDGYEIGTIRKKGYYLIKSPDRVNEANVQKYLTTKKYGQHIHYFETCESTQFIAHDEEQNGAARWNCCYFGRTNCRKRTDGTRLELHSG